MHDFEQSQLQEGRVEGGMVSSPPNTAFVKNGRSMVAKRNNACLLIIMKG